MADFDISIQKILKNEGGYVNDPNDPGGETKFGISKRSFPNHDIKNLTIDQAKQIYKEKYWFPIQGNNIKNQAIADSIFDFAVNTGVKTTVRLAQKCLNITADGIFGWQTIKAINIIYPELFLLRFFKEKINKRISICKNRPSSRKYLFGWIKRDLS